MYLSWKLHQTFSNALVELEFKDFVVHEVTRNKEKNRKRNDYGINLDFFLEH